jgi:protocatechuate 3,4-dioxygenase beta subunit
MFHPPASLSLRLLLLSVLLIFSPLALATPTLSIGKFGPGTVDGSAPFNVLGGCASATDNQIDGEDCGEGNGVVRTQDVVSHIWSITANNYTPGAPNLKNVVLEETIKPSANAVIQFENLPVVCTPKAGGGATPASAIKDNGDGSWTMTCNLGEFSEGQQKSLTVTVKISGKSQNGSDYVSSQKVYSVADDGVTENATGATVADVGPIKISAQPAYDLVRSINSTQGFYNSDVYYRAVKDLNNDSVIDAKDNEPGFITYGLIRLAAARKTGIEAIQQPLVFQDSFSATALAVNGAPYPLEMYVTECRDNPTGWGGEVFGRETYYPSYDAGTGVLYSAINSGTCSYARNNPSDPTSLDFTVTINNADLSGTRYPTKSFGGIDLSAGPYYAVNDRVQYWIPFRSIDMTDGVMDNQGSVYLSDVLTGFDPSGVSGTSNYGTGVEPGYDGATMGGLRGNNRLGPTNYYLTVRGSFTKYAIKNVNDAVTGYVWPGSGNHSGDGELEPGQTYVGWVQYVNNGTLALQNPRSCDVFDNTVQVLTDRKDSGGTAGTYAYVGTYAPNGFDYKNYVVEYAHLDLTGDDPLDGNHDGKTDYDIVTGRYNGDWTKARAARCDDAAPTGGWFTDPTQVAGGIDAVNAARVRLSDAAKAAGIAFEPGQEIRFAVPLKIRDTFNGGPHNGQSIPVGTVAADFGGVRSDNWSAGWTARNYIPAPETGNAYDGDRVTISRLKVMLDSESLSPAATPGNTASTLAGSQIVWKVTTAVQSTLPKPSDAENLRIVDELPPTATYNATCTAAQAGGTPPSLVQYNTDRNGNPKTGYTRLLWNFGNVTANTVMPPRIFCTDTDPLAPNGTSVVNYAEIQADNVLTALSSRSDTHTIKLEQTGSIQVSKKVDMPLDDLNDDQVYTLSWANFAAAFTINKPTIIDVLPFMLGGGDGASSLSSRTPASNFHGKLVLTGAPTVKWMDGSTPTGADPFPTLGTWYYSSNAPETIDYNPDANAAAGTTKWCLESAFGTAGCPAAFDKVTALKFVSNYDLAKDGNPRKGMLATYTMQAGDTVDPNSANANQPGDLYTNRFAFDTTSMDAAQFLRSNNVSVQVAAYSIGDFIFADNNQNGKYDAGIDAPAPDGVTVDLYNSSDKKVATTTTGLVGPGRYLFQPLSSGSYYIKIPASQFQTGGKLYGWKDSVVPNDAKPDDDQNETVDQNGYLSGSLLSNGIRTGLMALSANPPPPGGVPTGNEPTGDNVLPITDPTGDDFSNLTLDIGLLPPPSSLGDVVWNDLNQNGIQDVGELGLSNVLVKLLDKNGTELANMRTDAAGKYLFSNLAAGTYFVEITKPAGYTSSPVDQGADDTTDSDIIVATGRTAAITLGVGVNKLDVDAGLYKAASIGDRVWLDANADGKQDASETTNLANVTIVLKNSAGATVATTQTDANGNYQFSGLMPGTYKVDIDTASASLTGYTLTTGNDPMTVTLTEGQAYVDADFGFVNYASVGDHVWEDLNGNGLQDAGEPGIAGVTVRLLDKTGATVVRTTTTDASGNYLFSSLTPGDYLIEFAKPAAYAGFVTANQGADDTKDSDADVTTGRTAVFTLTGGANPRDVDAGLYKAASLGDLVWFDADGNGQQGVGETGVAGIAVSLSGTRGDGTAITALNTTTDASGKYQFTGLYPGNYTVKFTLAAGMGFTTQNAGTDDTLDSDVAVAGTVAATLASGASDQTLDAGIKPATVSGRVWSDNKTPNSIDDGAAESGVVGVTVNLINSATGEVVATTTTGANGNYTFTGVLPGNYLVQVLQPANMEFVLKDQGGNDAIDSDVDPANGKTASFAVASGDAIIDVDAGIKPGSLGDRVWLDLNGNNLQDSGEPGVAGVVVNLLDGSNNVVATQTTDANGFYNFDAILPGNYTVQFVPPAGMTFIGANQGTDDTLDSDPAGDGKVAVTVVSGVSNQTVDAGLAAAKLGDFVWLDKNGDGKQDAGEPPVVGMTVKLLDKNGNPVLDAGGNAITTVTDVDGKYQFTVAPGEYRVGFDKSAGVAFSPVAQGTVDKDSNADPATGMTAFVTLASGASDVTLDAGLLPALVSGSVIKDANANGAKDSGETGLAGVSITLTGTDVFGQPVSMTTTTAANGTYSFQVMPGTYTVKETNPVDYLSSGSVAGTATGAVVVGADGLTTPAVGGATAANNDFLDYHLGSIAGQVRHDTDRDGSFADSGAGIAGVTISLFTDPNGDGDPADGTLVGTVTTDASGHYLFSNVKPGNYVVVETDLDLWMSTADIQGANDNRIPVALASAQNSTGNDYLDAQQKGSLSGVVWTDSNADGVRGAGEPVLGGVKVVVTDAAGTVVANLTTAADGSYKADNLPPGTYTVTVDSSSLPAGVLQTGDPDGLMNNKTVASVSAGAETSGLDFGYVGGASLGDLVWDDLNGNGVQDAGEPGVGGVVVNLLDASGANILKTTTTNSSGIYGFTGLLPDDYIVAFRKPDAYTGFVGADIGGNDTKDSDVSDISAVAGVVTGRTAVVTLAGGANLLDVDAGLVKPASLGDFVWFDSNGDGIQQAGEPGMAGITVTLSGALANGSNFPPVAVQTDATGHYLFNNLLPGDYTVNFTLPAGMAFTTQDQGTDLTDSDVAANGSASVTLKSGDNNLSLDAGVQPAAVTGRVWIDDSAANAVEDAGEKGVVGVTVNLIDTVTGKVVATTTTGADGIYNFTGVMPGSYQVQVLEPANMGFVKQDQGSDDSVDSDVNPADGKSQTFSVTSGSTVTNVDAGIEPGSLGDHVWLDLNGNNLQDSGEPGVANVTVNLLDSAGTVVSSQTTDATGFYNFALVAPGDYTVQFVLPAGMSLVAANTGTDDTLDSDPAADGKVAVTVVSGVGNQTVDAGIVPAKLGDYVWMDLDGDGTQGASEPAVAGMTVRLLDKDGNPVKDAGGNEVTAVTDASGKYSFTLLPGEYKVGFVLPPLATFTKVDQGTNDAADSDADPTTGVTASVVVVSGDNNQTLDAGLLPAKVSGYAIEDLNADGKLDAGEKALPGVSISLTGTDVFGNPVTATTTTDNNGLYSFTVPAGTYTLTETNPVSYLSSGSQPGSATGASVINPDQLSTPVTGGSSSDNNNFLDYRVGSIVGQLRDDVDYDGDLKDAESGIGGATITLYTDPNGDGDIADGVKVASTATDSTGAYLFPNLKPGNYVVVESDLPLWMSTGDAAGANDNAVPVALASAQNSTGNDFLDAKQRGSLAGTVWDDTNTDGVHDAGETGLAGVTVTILNANGEVVATLTTDDKGAYLAENLIPGTYTVKVDPATVPANTQQTGDPDGVKDHQTLAVVQPDGQTTGIDFGYVGLVSVGDKVWLDTDANGIQDAGETGLSGVMVTLYQDANSNGVAEADEQVKAILTDSTGAYLFDKLLPLDYLVTFSLPEGYQRSPAKQGADVTLDSDADSNGVAAISLKSGSSTTVDAGFYKLGSIGDHVWLDANENGIQDAGEPAITDMAVKLLDKDGKEVASTTTNAQGNYLFADVVPGDYSVKFVMPQGIVATKADQGTDDTLDSDADASGVAAVTLASGQHIDTVDAGILPAAVSGRVWIDRNANAVDDTEAGVPGVSVKLVDAKTGDVVATTTTGAQGEYNFSGILPGDYLIEVVQPANMKFVTPDQGGDDTVDSDVQIADGRSAVFTLKSTDTVAHMDAGIEPGGLGDHVWLDQNGNGLQDAGEPGVANIAVKLLDSSGKEVATQATDATGFYNFTGVLPGDYTVQFLLPDGAQFTEANKGTDDELDSDVDAAGKVAVTVISTVGNQSVDAGIKPATISGLVIDDLNADGTQDDGEQPVAGVTVKLTGTDLFGNPVTLETVTDADGKYSFIVPPGTYTITETNPDGTVSTGSEAGIPGGTMVDADTLSVTVSSGQESVQNNFMDYQPASLSGQVRNDLDGDGNVADLDSGLANITVTLWLGDEQVASTTTDASGNYSFTGLKPGVYRVSETDSAGWVSTADVEGTNDNQITVTLASGDDKTGQDFLDTGLAAVGDKVWLDKNGNAMQDADEPGVAGVTVVLSGADGAGQAVNQTASTDANGLYQFTQLKPGIYTLEFQLPDGMKLVLANQGGDDAVDSDPDAISHKVGVTLLSAEQSLTVDAGVVPASISGVAWEDVNGDGIANGSEPVLAGVTVNLYSDPNGDGDPSDGVLVGTVTTTANGEYSFTGLLPDHYVVTVAPPEGYKPTAANQGNDDSVDSDMPPALSLPVTLQSGDVSHVDAGFYRPGSFGDRIWLDVNGNGKQDAGEPSVRDVVLVLMDASGNPVVNPSNPELPYRVTSDVDGEYLFTGLLPGKYLVQLEEIEGYLFTQTDAGSDDATDSDANANGRMTAIVTSASHNTTVDAGILPASISGRVWVDHNTPNALDDSMSQEPGVPGITVNLLDAQGNIVATTTSGTDGLYGFSGILPGEYRVAFVIPESLKLVEANVGDDDAIDSDADPETGLTDVFTVTSSTVVKDLDAGIQAGAIGDRVWADLNENGIQDAGEPGVAGVNVKLINSKGKELAMTTTDSSGFYAFRDVAPGDYTVQFVTGDLKLTAASQGEDAAADSNADPATGNATVTVVSGAAGDQTIDAGVLPAKIGDFVWLDANANGIQDQGEMPLANVAVILLDEDGEHVATTTTNSNGHYQFAVAPAYYSVQVVSVDSSFTKPAQGADVALDSDVNEMGVSPLKRYVSGSTVDTVDAGILPGTITGNVVDDLWADGNADATDKGIVGVTVTVTGTDSYGNPVTLTTVTGEDGSYVFHLPPGTYTVTENQPAGYVSTGSTAASTDGSEVVDKENVRVVLQSGWNASEVNFLDYDPSTWVTASGKVIDDHNHDGLAGATERGLEGVSVALYTDPNGDGDPSDGKLVETVLTDASGTFSFAKVPPGTYVIVETDPANFDSTADSVGENDNRATITLVAGEEPLKPQFLDAEPFSSLTGYVRLDTDRNGDLADPDAGIAGITLQLYSDPNGDGDPSDGELVATVQTDENGHYVFENVATGLYVIVETDKPGYISTADNATANDNRIPVSITVVDDQQSHCVVVEGLESCTGLNFLDSALNSGIELRKTAYQGHDGGAKCGTDEVKDKLTLVDIDKNLQEDATYCFEITNTGENWLANIVLVDETLGLTADKLTPIGTVPALLAPVSKDANAVIRYYYESVVTQSLVNTASATAKPALEDGTVLGDAVDAKGTGSVDLRFVFDPPTARKTVTANGDFAMLWQMVWINSSSDSVAGVQVYDGVPEGTHYVAMQAGANVSADGVYCEARGTSTTESCQYEAPSADYPRGRVLWKGSIGGDEGHTTETDAANEVVIRFYSMLDQVGEAQTISNQAHSSWDMDGDGTPEYADIASDNGGTDEPGDSTSISVGAATQIPTLSEWAMFLLSGLLVLVAFGYQRRSRKW